MHLHPIEALRHEHLTIETMLGVLEATTQRLGQRRHVDPQMVDGIFRFFDDFVARSHERKEEIVLFPLVAAGSEPCALATTTFTGEHASQRRLLDRIRAAARRALRGDAPMSDEPLPELVRTYAARMRENMHREERAFGDRGVCRLQAEDAARLMPEFDCIERAAIGPTGHEWFLQLVADYRDIVATWSHPPPTPARAGGRAF
jgi:hemerythrin-like domain-containing protein